MLLVVMIFQCMPCCLCQQKIHILYFAWYILYKFLMSFFMCILHNFCTNIVPSTTKWHRCLRKGNMKQPWPCLLNTIVPYNFGTKTSNNNLCREIDDNTSKNILDIIALKMSRVQVTKKILFKTQQWFNSILTVQSNF